MNQNSHIVTTDFSQVKGCVYKATSPSGKSYIGVTKNFYNRKKSHKHSARSGSHWFAYAIKKYGWENIQWEILYQSDSIDDLLEKERLFIAQYDTFHHGYNMNEGGVGLLNISREMKIKTKKTKRQSPFHAFKLPELSYVGTYDFISDCSHEIQISNRSIQHCLNPNSGSKKSHNYYFTYDSIDYVSSHTEEILDKIQRKFPPPGYESWNKGLKSTNETKEKQAFVRGGKRYSIKYLFNDKELILCSQKSIAATIGATRRIFQTLIKKYPMGPIYFNEYKISII